MRDIWRIIRFTKDLRGYYVAISLFTILLAGMSQLQPLFTKGAVDEIGSPARLAKSGSIYAQLLKLQGHGTETKKALKKYDIAS